MWYQIASYIKFLTRSTNQHGIHSPFIFNLVTKCFYNSSIFEDYYKLKNYKTRLKRVKLKLNVTDLGTGSKTLKSNTRSVSDIAKHVSISYKNAKLLYRITRYLKPQSILELGTSLGVATQAMSLANPEAEIITIEGCKEISKYTNTHFEFQFLENITIVNEDFSKAIPSLKQSVFDLIYFDGNHNKKATLEYFNMLLPKAHNDSIFIFDDIYWSKDMTEAWQTIINHPKVTVSIDTFSWGIIFFRTEQKKQHFTIRI